MNFVPDIAAPVLECGASAQLVVKLAGSYRAMLGVPVEE